MTINVSQKLAVLMSKDFVQILALIHGTLQIFLHKNNHMLAAINIFQLQAATISCNQNFAKQFYFSPVNSTCIPKFNSFECQCDNEFCDMQCDEAKCQNGNCHENGVCLCDVGYKGDNCEIQISECDKSPCSENGSNGCNSVFPGDYFCDCRDGWMGKNCQHPKNRIG